MVADQGLPPTQRRHRLLERDEFNELCEAAGGISDTEAYLEFLHHGGAIFYRAGLFGGRIVLDQDWALDAVYALFDRKRTLPLLRSYGRFTRVDLETLVWSVYSKGEQKVFLGMMESCGICFRTRQLSEEDWEYIAPELLPEWSEAEETLLAGRILRTSPEAEAEAKYGFLHEGLLRNYFSRIGRQAGDSAIYWKYGCWFYEKTTDSRVLIESCWEDTEHNAGAGRIRFRAWGDRARQLIEPLLTELEKLAIGGHRDIVWQRAGTPGVPGAQVGNPEEKKKRELRSLVVTEAVRAQAGAGQVYVSYAWGDDVTAEGRMRMEVVEGLCARIEAGGRKVLRDQKQMRYGDRISMFMKTLSRADLIVVVISGKYLRSPYCMAELYGIYQRSQGESEEFLRRIIPLVLDDAAIGRWQDRVEIARYWRNELAGMEQVLEDLSAEDFKLRKSIRDWHNRVGDMLVYVNDVCGPRGFDAIARDNFAALQDMLDEKQGCN